MSSEFVLIADCSESAVPFWLQTARATADLIAALQEDFIGGVYLLGTRLHWEAQDWRADKSRPPTSGGSFLAPVMAELTARHERPSAIVVVGAGPIFDLDDWLAIESTAQWALVRVGGESLQGASQRVLEVTPDDLKLMIDQLQMPARSSGSVTPQHNGMVCDYHWELDRAGYPLIKIDPLDAYWHLWPVTKPQFEYFLCDAPSLSRGDAWYAEVLQLNPRLSLVDHSLADYERLFATGLLPDEVRAYMQWCGSGCGLPTVAQWRAAFDWLAARDVSVMPAYLERHMAHTAQRLWHSLLKECRPQTMLDLALMRHGVIEWTQGAEDWLGMGQPRDTFFATFHDAVRDDPISPALSLRRSKVWGFRLMRRV